MRPLLATLLLLPLLAFGQAAPRYAVLSLLGDGITLATRDTGVGSGSEKAGRQFIPIADPALDNAAVLVVDDALRKAGIKDAVLMGLRDPAFYKAQSAAVEAEAGIEPLLPLLRPVAESAKVTHVILLTKYRHDAMMRMVGGSTGIGKVEGLGFYVDRAKPMRNVQTGEASTGYVAPFAYFHVAVVEMASGRVVAQARVLESSVVSKAGVDNPWDALNAEEKVRYLRGLMRRGLDRELPALLKNAG